MFVKNVMGSGAKSVNIVGVGEGNPEEDHFEAFYNEEVNFLANQGGGYRANYPRTGGNPGLNRDEGWRDRDIDWRDRNATWKERDGDKDSLDYLKFLCWYFWRDRSGMLKRLGDSPNDSASVSAYFSNSFDVFFRCFAEMDKLKESGRDTPLRKRAGGVVIDEDAVASRAKASKHLTKGGIGKGKGKGKGKSYPAVPEDEMVMTTLFGDTMQPPDSSRTAGRHPLSDHTFDTKETRRLRKKERQ
uniref:Integrase core domain containing protein n=1 Tax=Solanum tuberosum TaxID=4113 RepID=M1DD33_SOLTU